MVGVAQLVELRIVAPAVVGSNPIVHPSFDKRHPEKGAFFVWAVFSGF